MRLDFESTIEKIGRILARQYGINVVFEGEQAKTDGKTITLPAIGNLDEELKKDINGFIDHEVAHCKFTEFNQIGKTINKFHRTLLNATEDSRIEIEMIKEFPGTVFNLNHINNKFRKKCVDDVWDKLDARTRIIISVRDIMDGKTPRVDPDTERYIDAVRETAIKLRGCKSTTEVRIVTEEITRLLKAEAEDEKESGDGEPEKSDGEGSGDESDDGSDGKEGDSKDSGEGKGPEGDASEDGKPSGSKTKSKSKAKGKPSATSDSDSPIDFSESVDAEKTSIHDMIDEELKDHIKKEKDVAHRQPDDPIWAGVHSIPVTTRYDSVTDHSGKGDYDKYMKMKREIMKHVSPIKQQLERVLKVQENAKWRTERERGSVSSRDLSKLASNKAYRTVFKEFTKTETNNVAVQILLDLSGSMMSRIHTARLAAVALAEALKDLQIPFEITGFYSVGDNRVLKTSRDLGLERERGRFNRVYERLELHVFKSFDTNNLSGLSEIHVGHENPDGECVVWAAKRLAARKQKRKILIVLSDGEPSTGDTSRGVLCSDLKTKVQLIKKSGIECIGIGIATDCVKHFYPDYLVLRDVKELPNQAMRKLASLITKGAK